MNFKNIGSIKFENRYFDSDYIRNEMQLIKRQLHSGRISKSEVVGLICPRTERLLITILALLEENITFLPIDVTICPADRVRYMLDNANISKIITFGSIEFQTDNNITIINLDKADMNEENVCNEEYEEDGKDNELAYILYTSGSTGNPKAVEVTTKGLENFLIGVPEKIDFLKSDIIACLTNFTFDIFFLESVLALSRGLQVVLVNDVDSKNPRRISELIMNHHVTMIQMTPSRMKLLYLYDKSLSCLKQVQTIMLGGEKLPDSMLKILQESTNARIYNMYGPTETTIWSTISELTDSASVNIGEPIRNTTIYLLNDTLEIVSDNEIGEICIAGDGLAKGYINNEEQTNKHFVLLDTGKEQVKIYRTGDLGQYNEKNELIILGRIDTQVKIRGQRVELDEIDNVLVNFVDIENSVTCYIQEHDMDGLITYYVASEDIDNTCIIDFLASKLPAYMVPRIYIKIPSLIYTISGKVDRKSIIAKYGCQVELKERKKQNNVNEELFNTVKQAFAQNIERDVEISEDTLLSELGLNSISYISAIVYLEDVYNVEFDNEDLNMELYDSIGEIVQKIDELLNGTSV